MLTRHGDHRPRPAITAPVLLSAVVLIALGGGGCGSGPSSAPSAPSTTTASTSTTEADRGMVVMQSLAFTPDVARARVGQLVTWVNEDNVPHNVTHFSGPRLPSSPRVMDPGSVFTAKLTQLGTIHYFCTIHPWMHATIVVAP